MSVVVDVARREWEDGYRRFEAASRDPVAADKLNVQLEVVTAELRRRIGQTFTLEQLATVYRDADRWVQDALAEREREAGWPARMTTVQDAAFHVYSRGAVDYRP